MAANALETVLDTAPVSDDRLVDWLDDLIAELGAEVADCTPVPDADRIDRIARLEQLRAVVAAVQYAEITRFARSHAEAQSRAGVDPRKIGAGIADQIGMACHQSAFTGGRRLETAKALWFDLPRTFAALTAGELSERVAETVVQETRHLEGELRRQVDSQVIDAGITDMGVGAAGAVAKKYAYEADRQAYVDRSKTERARRRVTLRPAPDSMTFLTGHLPLEQGVACWAALSHAADTGKATGDARTRGQIMADTMVERLTGQATATDVNIEVQIVLPADLLYDPTSPRTATVQGFGPLPGSLAERIIDLSRGRKHWRTVRTTTAGPDGPAPTRPQAGAAFGRPFAGSPQGDNVVEIGRRRLFTGRLADLIRLRDQTCRMPYCDAPIRHLDHITPHHHGGPTTQPNGQGLCERHNYTRELPGWRTDLTHTGLGPQPHETVITTPTGHRYRSRAPDPP